MKLLSARWVVPVSRPLLHEGAVAVSDDGTVLAVGRRAELRTEFPDAAEERAQGVLLPGLVNAHCHLELSAHAQSIAGGAGFFAWGRALMQARAATPPERLPDAAAKAALSAARSGTAAIGDVGNSLCAAPAIGRAGMAGVMFHELLGSRDGAGRDALADAARERADAAATWPAGLDYVRAPHAPYSASADLLQRLFSAAATEGRATSIHLAEDEDEVALLRDGTGRWPAMLAGMGIDPKTRVPGKSPVAYLASLGAFQTETPPLLVHMVHAGADDRRIAREAGATVVLCPRSNLHIGGLLPDVEALVAEGGPLAIGTDSLASVPDLSLWGEISTLAAKFPDVPAADWIDAATRGGARALGLSGLGALEPGMRPGVLDVRLDAGEPLESLVLNPTPTLRWVARA